MTQIKKTAVVGATGQVGRLVLSIMAERGFPAGEVVALSSAKTAGTEVPYGQKTLTTQTLDSYDFNGTDLALFCVPTPVTAEYVPKATAAGCIVVDNSNQYRTDPDVPLVVPEINGHTIADYKNKKIITNGNCAAMQMLMAVKPLHDFARAKRIVVATYQSVSGAGYNPLQELPVALQHKLDSTPYTPENYPRNIAMNVIPQVDRLTEDGRTIEEWKMQHDSSRILGDNILVSATCVRVPVQISHSEAVNLEFENPISVEQAIECLKNFPGVTVKEKAEDYVVPTDATGTDTVFVSRIRKDHTVPHGLNLWVVADNLRKGAALNTVQIAECWLAYVNGNETPQACAQ